MDTANSNEAIEYALFERQVLVVLQQLQQLKENLAGEAYRSPVDSIINFITGIRTEISASVRNTPSLQS
jgi:hypothetical protein